MFMTPPPSEILISRRETIFNEIKYTLKSMLINNSWHDFQREMKTKY